MTLPSSNNPISLGQIQTEFGGSNPIALAGEYYRNGSYTTSNNTNVPTSGTISLSDFYGAYKYVACVVQTGTSKYGSGFMGYATYNKHPILSGPFITSTKSGPTDSIVTAGNVTITSYSTVGNYIIDYYTSNFKRYPDGDGFDYWMDDFISNSDYTSLTILGTNMQVSYDSDETTWGGIIGNYDNCNNKKK